MAMPVSALSSKFPSLTHYPTVKDYANTQCIPHFFTTFNAGRSTGKRRSLYLRLIKGSQKIVGCVGEDATSVPYLSAEKTDSLSATEFVKRAFPPGFWKDDLIDSLTSSYKVVAADEKRIQTLISEIKKMFRSMGYGEMSPSAYDTAWVARIPAVDGSDQPQFPETLQWILQNQLKDGSWGEELYFLAYERILNTLACVITLTLWRTGETHVQNGIEFLKTQVGKIENEADNHWPCGFEIIFPAMVNEAKILGLDLPYDLPFLKQILQKREVLLKRTRTDALYTLPTKSLYFLEGSQEEIVDWDKIMKLQSKDGSFLSSPASTAAAFMGTGNKKCLDFLNFGLKKFGNHVPCQYPIDLFERLWAVDTVERLGIDRHFRDEIKDALDYVYSYWDESGIGWARETPVPDIDSTAMGLRILRLHGYNISSDVLKAFRDENGEFFFHLDETQRGVTSMFNFYRCSHVSFPGETIMEEAKQYSERYLRNALENVDALEKYAFRKNIGGEVEYALKYPWHNSMPRLEARSYIENYGPNDVWLGKTIYKMPCISNEKYLELAKLDFNKVQSIHQKELRDIRRWWKSSGFSELNFTRERVTEIYFSPATFMFEPEFAMCREVYTKISIFTLILDDLYDAYGSLDDLKLFLEAVRRWDLSLIDRMPYEMEICFMGIYNTCNEIAEEGCKKQGRDVLSYIRNVWEILLAAYTKEAEWCEAKYVPSFEEYIENASVSITLGTIVLISALFTGEVLTDHALAKIDHKSRFLQLMGLTGHLANDTKTYEAERGQGEVASAIQCYMKDHPKISEEEALNYVYSIMENALEELNMEFVNNIEVPNSCKRLAFDIARIMQLFYMEGDGLTLSHDMDIKEHVKHCLFIPVA